MKIKEFFSVGEVFRYFFRVFRKQEGEKSNLNLRMMHWTNRISIVMFLICVLVIVYRYMTR
ncbi:MAG: hypothetical protein MUF42_10395 [Cytophagaceae bacterium]|jgi:hypothetical protein|nr:hypothetical protein [Cytophagaceae bacterium]